MGTLKNRIVLFVFGSFFVAIVVTGIVMTIPKYFQLKGLQERRAEFAVRIEECKREIAEIRKNSNRLSSDRDFDRAFVEKLARQNRRVFPGELVFIFDDSKSK